VAEPCGSLAELRAALDGGRTSAAQLVEQSLARAEALEPTQHAFVRLRADAARAEARESDGRRARGERRSPLDGIPVAIKDNLVRRGEPTTCASRILEGYVSPYDATAVAKLAAAGAIAIGSTNLDEFAMGSSTENSAFGPTRNPWNPARTPGGSSGGSAAVVAAGIVPIALGSDTGGSIRQPASFCGVVGVKPTYGRVSRWGLVAFASSLDQVGVFARSAADAAVALEVICGHDPRDSTSLPEPAPSLVPALSGDVSGLVIGLPREYFASGAEPAVVDAVRGAVAELEAAGAKVREVALPHTPHAVAAYYLIATAEASSNLARYDGVRYGHRAANANGLTDMYLRTRSEGFGAEVKRRIILGTYVLSAGYYDAYYRKAQQVRTLLRRDLEAAFRGCDVLATPTCPEVAFEIGAKSGDPVKMYLSDVYTVSANLAGLPGASVPCGSHEGLPIGLQLLAPPLDEATLLRAADAYQRRTRHHVARPPERA
jgi:aspartyl-tRNA(Asn)/glutamyl-tRNA(Gln) amidotransferase subunit A